MKTELTDRFENIEVKMILYRAKDNPQKDLDEYIRDAEAIEKRMGFKMRRFEQGLGRPEAFLESYGAREVVVEYLCDNFVNWEGGKIIRASVTDGAQAQRFLEHCLNNYGEMSGAPIQGRHSFGDIPFQTKESEEGRRTLNLVTGAEHPQLMWREMYNIFVDELNGRGISAADIPKKWYQRLLGRLASVQEK